jgi:hypothetical protein
MTRADSEPALTPAETPFSPLDGNARLKVMKT